MSTAPALEFPTLIALSVHRGRSGAGDKALEPSGEDYKFAREEALEEAQEACHFCRHCQPGFMQVHQLNCNHKDLSPEKLVAVCFICHANHHLWLAGKSRSNQGDTDLQMGAFMAHLPGVSQGVLNRFLMACFAVKKNDDTEMRDRAIKALDDLRAMAQPVEEMFGSSSAQAFGIALADLPESAYEYRSEIMSNVKMVITEDSELFLPSAINDLAQSWKSLMPVSSWESIRETVFAQTTQVSQ